MLVFNINDADIDTDITVPVDLFFDGLKLFLWLSLILTVKSAVCCLIDGGWQSDGGFDHIFILRGLNLEGLTEDGFRWCFHIYRGQVLVLGEFYVFLVVDIFVVQFIALAVVEMLSCTC